VWMSSGSTNFEDKGDYLNTSEGLPPSEDGKFISVHLSDISNEKIPKESKKQCIRNKQKIPAVRTYCFKKKKPLPGAYPVHFSPYKMVDSSNVRAVSLSNPEIRDDLHLIGEKTVFEFPSKYFDEVAVKSGHTSGIGVLITSRTQVEPKFQQRIARRKTTFVFQAPQSPAEERRQVRAAIQASRLELAQSAETWSGRTCKSEKFTEGGMRFMQVCPPA
jgi:hypothetical protein